VPEAFSDTRSRWRDKSCAIGKQCDKLIRRQPESLSVSALVELGKNQPPFVPKPGKRLVNGTRRDPYPLSRKRPDGPFGRGQGLKACTSLRCLICCSPFPIDHIGGSLGIHLKFPLPPLHVPGLACNIEAPCHNYCVLMSEMISGAGLTFVPSDVPVLSAACRPKAISVCYSASFFCEHLCWPQAGVKN